MTELNGNTYKVTKDGPFKFVIDCDTREFNKYESEGYATEVKVPFTYKFKRLE